MRYFITLLVLVSSLAVADQRMETVGGFCHMVTPQGLMQGNDDNEVFLSNCVSSIRQRANGQGYGVVSMKVPYPPTSAPFFNDYRAKGNSLPAEIDCVMVDSNGTRYVTQDWTATYKIKSELYDECLDYLKDGKFEEDCDLDKSGFLSINDINILKRTTPIKIEYNLICRNGFQQ